MTFIGSIDDQLCENWKLCQVLYFLSQSFLFEMAEWGKGDPRWIVEERPDGKKNNDILFF